jgi:RND family efflux transporter MFP subunit
MNPTLKNWVLPPLVAVFGVGATVAMIALKPEEARSNPEPKQPSVQVLAPQWGSFAQRIQTTGVVEPAQQVTVMPQVSGMIVEVSEDLVPGGRLSQGQTLARIDGRDYRLAIQQEQSRVRQAELELQLEHGRTDIAAREWELLEGQGEPDLALRRPHLESAKTSLQSAQSGLERAELNLSRTHLRAPFNAVVLSESVDEGQVVGATGSVATLAGTDLFWVRVPVPVERIQGLDIPGSRAVVTVELGAQRIEREGQVLGLEGQLDPQSRTATVLVGVEHPLDPPEGEPPLLLGSFVDVELVGRRGDGVVASIPRDYIDEGAVWVADELDQLQRREVQIAWVSGSEAYLDSGLQPNDRLVTGGLGFPVPGMGLTVVE